MAIFSQAKAVLNPDDSPMSVREALIEINAALDEHLSQDEGAFDADTRFALTFFESFGYAERDFGDAEGLDQGAKSFGRWCGQIRHSALRGWQGAAPSTLRATRRLGSH